MNELNYASQSLRMSGLFRSRYEISIMGEVRHRSRNPFVCQVYFDPRAAGNYIGYNMPCRNPFVCQVYFDGTALECLERLIGINPSQSLRMSGLFRSCNGRQ